jgi:hypothetical protein
LTLDDIPGVDATVVAAGDDARVLGSGPASKRRGSFPLRCVFVAACLGSFVFTLLHEPSIGAACGIVGYAGLFGMSAREDPEALRTPVPAVMFWAAVGVMAFLGAYVMSNRI